MPRIAVQRQLCASAGGAAVVFFPKRAGCMRDEREKEITSLSENEFHRRESALSDTVRTRHPFFF
jgi:hypothetical protein